MNLSLRCLERKQFGVTLHKPALIPIEHPFATTKLPKLFYLLQNTSIEPPNKPIMTVAETVKSAVGLSGSSPARTPLLPFN